MTSTSCPFQTAGRKHLSFVEIIIFPLQAHFLLVCRKNVQQTF